MAHFRRSTLAWGLGLSLGSALLTAAPTPDNDAAKVYNASPCAASFSATYNTLSGANQVLLVTVECEACSAPTTVSYNGSTMSLELADTSASLNEWTYAIVAPPTGVGLPVAVTLGASYCGPMAVFAVSYSGVNQATPVGSKAGWVGATSMSNGVNSVGLGFTPSNANSTVVEISYERQPSGASLALSQGLVRFVSNNVTNNSNGDYGFGDWSPGSVSPVTLQYSWNLPGIYTSDYTDVQAIELLPFVAGPPSVTPSPTPTPSVSPSPTGTASASPTATPGLTQTATAAPSATTSPTPGMALIKTSNVSVATIGDTLTFCIAYKNDSSGTVTMSVWDTISADLTYAGCNGGCVRSAGLVQWSIPGVTSGATGAVCFWGVVSGYP